MKCSSIQKTDIKECLATLLKNKNKGVPYDEWKNKKNMETFKSAQIREVESFMISSFDQLVRSANRKSRSEWLRAKNTQLKKICKKQRNEDECRKTEENELEKLRNKHSKKAYKSWLQFKEKETKEKDLKLKEDEACCNMCNEYFHLVRSEYNKKAIKQWLHDLKARRKENLFLSNC